MESMKGCVPAGTQLSIQRTVDISGVRLCTTNPAGQWKPVNEFYSRLSMFPQIKIL